MKKLKAVLLSTLLPGIFCAQLAIAQKPDAGKLPDAPAAKAQAAPSASPSPFKDDKQREGYAIGMNIGNGLRNQSVDVDVDAVAQGIKDALAGGKTLMTEEEATAALNQLEKDLKTKHAQANQDFLATNKTKEGVVVLPSGLQYKILSPGTGPKPTLNDTVVCNYKGTFIDGKEFDSSYTRHQPATFPVSGVIKGWTEALQLMPVGSKWQLIVPPDLAYGQGRPGIPPDSTLVFEVELISIQAKDKPQDAPATK